MHRRFFRSLVPALFLSLLLTACGGGGKANTDDGGDTGHDGGQPSPPAVDTVPDPIAFVTSPPLLPGTLAISAAATINGLGEPVEAKVSAGGEISVNGSAWTSAPVTVKNGDSIRVRAAAGELPGGIAEITLKVGASSATFKVKTAPAGTIVDTHPEAFALAGLGSAEPGSTIVSDPVIVSGINTGALVSLSGPDGSILIIDGEPVSSDADDLVIYPGQSIAVSLPAPDSSNSISDATLTIGDTSETLTIVIPPVEGETDLIPDPLPSETPILEGDPAAAEPGQFVTFGPLPVSGIDADIAIVIAGAGEYSIDGGTTWSNADQPAATVSDGTNVYVRILAAPYSGARTEAKLAIGGISHVFAVTTRILPAGTDTEPDLFSFEAQTGVTPGSQTTSNSVAITGIDTPAPIRTDNGSYSINGSQFMNVSGAVVAGQTVKVRTVASIEMGVSTVATLTVGNVPSDFSITTFTAEENLAPIADAGTDQIVDEGVEVILAGSATDVEDDAAGTALTYAWAQSSGPAVTLAGVNTATPAFTGPDVTADTVLVFTLTVTDSAGATATDTVTVNVRFVNQPPVANAGSDQTADEGQPVTLNGSGSDPDGGAVTLEWTQVSGPVVALSSTTASAPSFTAPNVTADAILDFTLKVTDATGGTATDSVAVTVAFVNQLPKAKIAGSESVQSAYEGAQFSLDGTPSTDPDGNITSYHWEQLSGPSGTINDSFAASAAVTLPFVASSSDVVFKLTVTDSKGEISEDQITVTVLDDVADPSLSLRFPFGNALMPGAAGVTLTLSGSASDDSGISSVTVNGESVSTADEFSTWTYDYVLTEGLNELVVEAADLSGKSVTESFSVNTAVDARLGIGFSMEVLRSSGDIKLNRDRDSVRVGASAASGLNGGIYQVDRITGDRTLFSSGSLFDHEVTGDVTGYAGQDGTSVTRLIEFNIESGTSGNVSDNSDLGPPLADRAQGLCIDRTKSIMYWAAPRFTSLFGDRNASVIRIDLTTGDRLMTSNDSNGAGPKISETLRDCFVEPTTGNLWVLQADSILRVDVTTGNRAYMSDIAGNPLVLTDATGFTYSPEDHLLYVVERDGALSRIVSVDPDTGSTNVVVVGDAGAGPILDNVQSVDYDALTRIFYLAQQSTATDGRPVVDIIALDRDTLTKVLISR